MVSKSKPDKEVSAITDLLKSKVYVTPSRYKELIELKDAAWSELPLPILGPERSDPAKQAEEAAAADVTADQPATLPTLMCINLSEEIEAILQRLPYTIQVERFTGEKEDKKEDKKRFAKLFSDKVLLEGSVACIILEVHDEEVGPAGDEEGDQLTLFDRRVMALSLLNGLPVVALSRTVPTALHHASAASGHTWPVYFIPNPEDAGAMCKWLAEELPRVRRLAASIRSDLAVRVAPLGRVNLPLHFLSRASVALVPFGVMTVNLLGIMRLMALIMREVGMRGDSSANKALGLLGAKNAALVTAIDSLGDVYQYTIFATVLADLHAMAFVEMLNALTVLDGLALGSITLVTGAVSAIGAALSRPQVVRAAAEFLASLQLMYVLNPHMRRTHASRKKGKGKAGGKILDKEGKCGDREKGAYREMVERRKRDEYGEAAEEGEAEGLLGQGGEEQEGGEGEGEGRREELGGPRELLQRSECVRGRRGQVAEAAFARAELRARKARAKGKQGGEEVEWMFAGVELSGVGGNAAAVGLGLAEATAREAGAEGVETGVGGAVELSALSRAERAAKAAEEKAAALAAKAAAKEEQLMEKQRVADERKEAKQAEKEAKEAAKLAEKEAKEAAKAAKAAEKEAEKARKAEEAGRLRAEKEAEKAAKEAAKAAAKAAKVAERSGASAPPMLAGVGGAGAAAGVQGGPAGVEALRLAMARAATAVREHQAAAAAAGAGVGLAGPGVTDPLGRSGGQRESYSSGTSGSSGGSASEDIRSGRGAGWGGNGWEGDEGEAAGSEEGEEEDPLAAAVARDERMGLDEQLRFALMDFLSLEDDKAYAHSASDLAEGQGQGQGQGQS